MSGKTAQELSEQERIDPEEGGWAYNHELNPSQQDYDQRFNHITSSPDNQALNDQGGAIARDHAAGRNADTSRQAVKDGEKKAVGDTAVGKAAEGAAGLVNPAVGQAVKLLGKIKTRGGATGAVVAGIMVALVALGSLLGGALAPVAFMRNVVGDLNDQLASLDNVQEKLLKTRITNKLSDEFLAGCSSKLSIRCKMKSVSSKDVARLASADIKLVGKTKTIAGRVFSIEGYQDTRTGKIYDAKTLAEAFKTNTDIRLRFKGAINMGFWGFADRGYKLVTEKLGITKAKPTPAGDTLEEKVKNFATGEDASKIPVDAEFIPQVDENGKETGKYVIKGTGVVVTQSQYNLWKTKMSLAVQDWFKLPVGSSLLKAVNILGAADIICTAGNTIGTATVMSKYAKNLTLARYAAPIIAAITAIMAGDGTVEDGQMVGRFFGDPDNRAMIEDLPSSTKNFVNNGNQQMIEVNNPYFGKSAMDSGLYKLSTGAATYTPTPASILYSLSLPISLLFGAFGSLLNIFNQVGGDSACDFVQSWGVRTIGLIVGIVAMFFGVGEANWASNLVLMGAIAVVFFTASHWLTNLANGYMVPPDINKKPEEKAAATWTGIAAIMGHTAQTRGLAPGNKKSIKSYRQAMIQSTNDYLAIETQSTPWYDTRSPNSLVGRLALGMKDLSPKSLNVTELVASSRNIIGAALAKPSMGSVSATTYSDDRFTHCEDDIGYKEMGYDPDVQCNLRFVSLDSDMGREADGVYDYMIKNGYINQDTDSGLPDGYTPPDANTTSNVVGDIISGAVNTFYNTRQYPNEYAVYLDFCVFRVMPWGRTYQETGAIGAVSADWVSGKRCGEDSEMVSNFRSWWGIVGGLDATEPVSPNRAISPVNQPTTTTPAVTTQEVRMLAQQILDLAKAKKITIVDYSTDATTDRLTRSLASQQLTDMAAGLPIGITTRCGFTIAPITADPKILQFLVDLGQQYNYKLNSLFGQCHSQTSAHYKGSAVDFGCPTDTSIADTVGTKYGVSHNFENCADHRHWHYSVGGH